MRIVAVSTRFSNYESSLRPHIRNPNDVPTSFIGGLTRTLSGRGERMRASGPLEREVRLDPTHLCSAAPVLPTPWPCEELTLARSQAPCRRLRAPIRKRVDACSEWVCHFGFDWDLSALSASFCFGVSHTVNPLLVSDGLNWILIFP